MKFREIIASTSPRKIQKNSWSPRPFARRDGLGLLVVHPSIGEASSARLHAGPLILRCAIGKSGIRHSKREGDHATPAGTYRLLGLRQRHDRLPRLTCALPTRTTGPRDGWCDDPHAARYNEAIPLPAPEGHEQLYRDDHVYDLVVVLDHNRRPRVRGHGSAIFFHLSRPDDAGTEGCVAISGDDMRRLLPRLARHVRMRIG
jgi:L,D-peptidoglycan transpeptidase YkuD (ErfK/YbiS/YcfS/YnhG family)